MTGERLGGALPSPAVPRAYTSLGSGIQEVGKDEIRREAPSLESTGSWKSTLVAAASRAAHGAAARRPRKLKAVAAEAIARRLLWPAPSAGRAAADARASTAWDSGSSSCTRFAALWPLGMDLRVAGDAQAGKLAVLD